MRLGVRRLVAGGRHRYAMLVEVGLARRPVTAHTADGSRARRRPARVSRARRRGRRALALVEQPCELGSFRPRRVELDAAPNELDAHTGEAVITAPKILAAPPTASVQVRLGERVVVMAGRARLPLGLGRDRAEVEVGYRHLPPLPRDRIAALDDDSVVGHEWFLRSVRSATFAGRYSFGSAELGELGGSGSGRSSASGTPSAASSTSVAESSRSPSGVRRARTVPAMWP